MKKGSLLKVSFLIVLMFSSLTSGVSANGGDTFIDTSGDTVVESEVTEYEFSESEILPTEEELSNLEGLIEGPVEESEEMIIPAEDLQPETRYPIGGLIPQPTGPGGYETDAQACVCGSYSAPVKVTTNIIDMNGVPLEYGFYKGNFIIFERPDLYYYRQNATQGRFNMVTGQVVLRTTQGLGTMVGFKGINKVPYMAKLFDSLGRALPYNIGNYVKLVAAYQVESKVPLYGHIISTPVPAVGTKQVLIYISKDNKKWQRRILFTYKDGKVTYKNWWVN